MLTSEQTKNISYIYQKLMASENMSTWSNTDCYLELLEFLDDSQLWRETEVLYSNHRNKVMGCPYKHEESSVCLVTYIMEAVDSILELYHETQDLHTRSRYIISYYLALCQAGLIVELPEA